MLDRLNSWIGSGFGDELSDVAEWMHDPRRHDVLLNASLAVLLIAFCFFAYHHSRREGSRAPAAVLIVTGVLAEIGEPVWAGLLTALALSGVAAVLSKVREEVKVRRSDRYRSSPPEETFRDFLLHVWLAFITFLFVAPLVAADRSLGRLR